MPLDPLLIRPLIHTLKLDEPSSVARNKENDDLLLKFERRLSLSDIARFLEICEQLDIQYVSVDASEEWVETLASSTATLLSHLTEETRHITLSLPASAIGTLIAAACPYPLPLLPIQEEEKEDDSSDKLESSPTLAEEEDDYSTDGFEPEPERPPTLKVKPDDAYTICSSNTTDPRSSSSSDSLPGFKPSEPPPNKTNTHWRTSARGCAAVVKAATQETDGKPKPPWRP